MNVTELLARLSRGLLSNLSLSNEGNGTIQAGKIPALVDHINEALLHLYTRFDLSEKEMVIVQQANLTRYRLRLSNALSQTVSAPAGTPLYIQDSASNPFADDLVKVLGVYNTRGQELPLNDNNAPASLFTPQHDLLQVPHPAAGVPLYIIYQAKHKLLTHTVLNENIELPTVLEEAAIAYVAAKVFDSMNGPEHAAKATSHMAAYQAICAEVTDRDLVNTSLSTIGSKFEQRGFC